MPKIYKYALILGHSHNKKYQKEAKKDSRAKKNTKNFIWQIMQKSFEISEFILTNCQRRRKKNFLIKSLVSCVQKNQKKIKKTLPKRTLFAQDHLLICKL